MPPPTKECLSLRPYRVLTLDGGGSKGLYTLGVLKELEAFLDCPICEAFDEIYGTSTGSIIAAMLSLGASVNEIVDIYRDHVPEVMTRHTAGGRTRALSMLARKVFRDRLFSDVRTALGIVAARWDLERPIVFKSSITHAHGRSSTFLPGFGCSLADAVVGSCSAYPFFKTHQVLLPSGERIELIDGGYCANDPTLYAIADAIGVAKTMAREIRLVSLGVGHFPPRHRYSLPSTLRLFPAARLLQKTLSLNACSMEQLRRILFNEIKTVRVDGSFHGEELSTDFLEADTRKLDLLFQCGRLSFAQHEADFRALFPDR